MFVNKAIRPVVVTPNQVPPAIRNSSRLSAMRSAYWGCIRWSQKERHMAPSSQEKSRRVRSSPPQSVRTLEPRGRRCHALYTRRWRVACRDTGTCVPAWARRPHLRPAKRIGPSRAFIPSLVGAARDRHPAAVGAG
eukprot:scaffold1973_cov399-Prasinococcus_capsulatus_cf.AAC.24